MNHWDENDFRRLAFDYVRGDLNEEDATAIENRMVDSPAYREYVQRIDSMIGAARKAPPVTEKINADFLFSKIESAIRAEDQKEEQPVIVHVPQYPEGSSRRSRLLWPALAMAAALALVGVWFATSQMPNPSSHSAPKMAAVDVPEAPVVAVAAPRST